MILKCGRFSFLCTCSDSIDIVNVVETLELKMTEVEWDFFVSNCECKSSFSGAITHVSANLNVSQS